MTENEKRPSLFSRIAVGVGAPLGLLSGALILKFIGGPPCMLYVMTGIYCPGCGAGRCCKAILDFRFLDAFTYNPLVFFFVPFLAYVIIKYYVKHVFGKDILPDIEMKTWMGVVLAVGIVLFGILRNIPVFPFTYLAPHAFGSL